MDVISTINIRTFKDKNFTIKINLSLYLSLGFGSRLRSCISYGTQKCYIEYYSIINVLNSQGLKLPRQILLPSL